jgi:Tfp pilus assembly protein PilO
MTKLRQLWLLTALGSLAVLAGGYFLLVSPQASKAAALREEADTQLQANRQIQSSIALLNKQKKDLPKLQAELEKFAIKIPNNPALPSLIRGLSDAADASGVQLNSISPAVPNWTKGVNLTNRTQTNSTISAPGGAVLVDIPVAIEVSGTYGQISQFFSELESLPRAMMVGGFALRPGGPTGTSASATTTVDQDMLTATISSQVSMTAKQAAAPPPPVAPSTDATK